MKSDHKINNVKITLEWNYRIEQKFRSGCQRPFAHLTVVTLPYQQRRTFLLLSFFCLLKKDCMNRVRSLLSMRGMLLGYNFKPRPNRCVVATVYTGSVMTISLSIPINPPLSPPPLFKGGKPPLSIKPQPPQTHPLHTYSSQTINVD